MILTSWPCPRPDDPTASELALICEAAGPHHILVLPALFDEGNRLRRFTVEVMRRLAAAGIASTMPELPGCNDSLAPLEAQTLDSWRAAATAAAHHFGTSHVLTIRAAASLAPPGLPGWHYAPHPPASQLRQLLRARVLASREAGVEEKAEALLAKGTAQGLELAGYRLGPAMLAQLQAELPATVLPVIAQSDLAAPGQSAPGLWLRAEPGEDPAQADKLAAILTAALTGRKTP